MSYYDQFVERSADAEQIAMMDLETIAEQVADLLGDAYAEGDYPRDDDGMIDLYGIARKIRNEAERIMAQREVTA